MLVTNQGYTHWLTLQHRIAAFGIKLARSLSGHRDTNGDAASLKFSDKSERSISRGRDFLSSGRGGLGNIRQSSLSRDGRPDSGPDDFSPTRGREPNVRHQVDKLYSTGRGGAGNIRSPSRDVSKVDPTELSDKNFVKEHLVVDENAPHSSGRGGLGNINRSRSRDPHDIPLVHSSGRGGVGNIHPGAQFPTAIEEEERKKIGKISDIHSVGRGGSANLTSEHEPPIERYHQHAQEYESTGRGGAGNIIHETHN